MFRGFRAEGLPGLGDEYIRATYLHAQGDDLLIFSYTIDPAKNPNETEWRDHLLVLIAGGILARDTPKEASGGSWLSRL